MLLFHIQVGLIVYVDTRNGYHENWTYLEDYCLLSKVNKGMGADKPARTYQRFSTWLVENI
jgi:hypothetical protein